MTHRHLWLDPTFGASGDMMLGALVGLGAPIEDVATGLKSLPIDGWRIEASTVQRGSLSATRVSVDHEESHHHRTWTSIDTMLSKAPLPDSVIAGARTTFRTLGQVEADIHGVSIDEVHFHEVGAVDAIVDIVGAWLARDLLDIEAVSCGPIGVGHGTITAAHGLLPLPAPATAALLQGAVIRSLDVPAETVTPTGAALLTTMATQSGAMPTGTLLTVARGAGGRDPEQYPNVLSVYLIETEPEVAAAEGPLIETQAIVLQTNLDDVTGETVAHTIARCLELGADDAWAHPIVMKKGRPGVELNVLTSPDLVDVIRQTVLAETASLGVRTTPTTKHAQPRAFQTVDVDGHSIQIKVGPHGAKPEYDDLATASRALGRPLTELANRALQQYYRASGPGV
jgi:uncharacterized protein (TIGR00299 family) protein